MDCIPFLTVSLSYRREIFDQKAKGYATGWDSSRAKLLLRTFQVKEINKPRNKEIRKKRAVRHMHSMQMCYIYHALLLLIG